MRDPEPGGVFAPQRLEVVGHADLATAIHLGRLAVELGQGDLGRRHRVGHGHIELHVELVLLEIVDMPALAEPPRPLLVRLEPEPVRVRLLVALDEGDQGHVLLFQPLDPGLLVPGAGIGLELRDLADGGLCRGVDHVAALGSLGHVSLSYHKIKR